MFLVTNKHVIAGSHEGILRFTLRTDDGSGPDLGKYSEVNIPPKWWKWWTRHPDKDVDVAAFPLNPTFEEMATLDPKPFYSGISHELLPENSPYGDLKAVERILFIGYPNGIYDTKNNLPLIRSGITATPPTVDYKGKPIFLIDASVFPGSSGSPIFAYDRGAWLSEEGTFVGGSERVVFLGVLAKAFFRKLDGTLEFRDIPTATQPVPVNKEMIDLGVAYKAVTVIETIEECLRNAGQM